MQFELLPRPCFAPGVSAQYPGREVFLQELITKMSGSDTLPSIEEIERVWFELLREVRETGVVTN